MTAQGVVPVVAPAVLATLAVALALPAPVSGRRRVRACDSSVGSPTADRPGASTATEPEAPGALLTGAAALGAGAGVAFLVGSGLGLLLGLVTVPVVWRWLGRLEPAAVRQRRERLVADLPLLVDLLAACLRAGQAPGSALAAVTASLQPGPLRTEAEAVIARLSLGGDPLETWRALGRHGELGPLGRTVARAMDGGASVANAMGDLAEELRRTRRAAVQARARSVGARAAAPLGLCLLPAFVLVGIVPVVAGSLDALLLR